MRPSKEVRIKTLRKNNPHDYLVENIELLGSDEKINFTRTEEYLEINLKGDFKNDLPICFKIAIGWVENRDNTNWYKLKNNI